MFRRSRLVLLSLSAAVVVGGVGVFFLWRQTARSEETAAAAVLVREKNVGLARLENGDGAESVPPFARIAAELPQQPLGPRNLAVARLVALAALGPDAAARPAAVAAAEAATAELAESDPEPAVALTLAARVARVKGEVAAAIGLLKRATAAESDAAWLWYELHKAARDVDPDLADASLGRTHAAAPENLWALREWIVVQARTHDPTIDASLERLRDVLAPLAEGIRLRTRAEPLKFVADARAAAAAGDWPAVVRSVRALANVTAPEEQAQSDRLRIDRNPLEFVIVDFPPEFYETKGLARLPADDPIPVSFAAFPTEAFGTLAGVRDAKLADFDLDGRLDVLALTGMAVVVFTRDDSGRWREAARHDLDGSFTRLLAADLDADAEPGVPAPQQNPDGRPCHAADVDLVLTGPAGVVVLENRKDAATGVRSLVPVEQPAPLAALKDIRTATLFDLDLDGDLDLFAAGPKSGTLWINRGDRTFGDVSARSALPDAPITTVLPADIDRDIDIDLLVGGPKVAGYLENLRHGEMRFRPFGTEGGPAGGASGFEILDADANASWDVLAATAGGVTLTTSQTPELGRLRWLGTRTVLPGGDKDALLAWDYDNDGLRDLLTWGDAVSVFRNVGGTSAAWEPGPALESQGPVVAIDVGDLDGDGDTDLLIAAKNGIALHENRGGNANAWLDVSLLAAQVKGAAPSASGRVNHAGLGSLLELKAGPTYQPLVVRDGVTHFGLGGRTRADALRVVWTNGIPGNVLEPAAKQFLCEEQTLKGSCPYLYTWDGTRFVFATDLLWAAPIGLQFAEGVIAPTRPWEHLLVPGDLLKPRGGEYVLQVTEELWEAAYFDRIELLAVDHPADVAVYSNEKVGTTDVAFKIHTVRRPRPPRAATDSLGRNVLPEIAARDEVYLKPFARKLRQGQTEPHWIELDLGDLSDARTITLFLTGWVYPSDTSINVGLGQNPDGGGPWPPSLLVPNAAGEWVVALPSMGFPGGKTKTIAIDLSGLFQSQDYRVRIASSMELYWDEIFFTADETLADVTVTPLRMTAADLHFRGVSARVPHPGFGPERYDYARVSPPDWPPMNGAFTQYGDVTPLVRTADDLQVVMAAGDELTIRFAAPPGPPPGWTRDFILHDVGYDKDADLNTVYGRDSEPLPFREMKSYPYEPAESFPDSPAVREYLRTYQTRLQSDAAFRTRLRP